MAQSAAMYAYATPRGWLQLRRLDPGEELEPGTELQALITDQHLAGAMSGAQLAQYARRRHPHMNIIIMSGRTVEPIPVNTTFLQKPFTAAQLLEAVRD